MELIMRFPRVIAQSFGRVISPHLATILLGLSMFATGASGLVSEYILATVSTYILGNSIEQFSIIVATMMLMMGVAGFVQQFITKNLIEKFILVEVCLALIGGFAPIMMYYSFSFMDTHFAFVQYFFVGSMGFLVGFEIPLILRINREYSKDLKGNVALVFSLDYIGAFVGAIIWTKFLLKSFPITEISFLLAGSNFLIAVITFIYFLRKGKVKRRGLWFGVICLTALALMYGYSHNRDWNVYAEQKMYDDKILYSQTTKYQHLVMTYYEALDDYRFYINGNLQWASTDEHIYHDQLVHPLMNVVDRKKVLILGGGDGLALREVLKYPGVEEVTLVDLDPEMTVFCSTNPVVVMLNDSAFSDARVSILKSGAVTVDTSLAGTPIYQETGMFDSEGEPEVEIVAQVKVLNMDADLFVSEIKGKWNAIIIDFPDPNSIELGKLYTREFFLKIRQRLLAENGALVIQSTSPIEAVEAFMCIKRTLEAAGFKTLPYHDNVPSFGEWGWILAWKNERIGKRIARLDHFNAPTRYLTPELFQASKVFGKDQLKTVYKDINTLMRPVLHTHYVDNCWLLE